MQYFCYDFKNPALQILDNKTKNGMRIPASNEPDLSYVWVA